MDNTFYTAFFIYFFVGVAYIVLKEVYHKFISPRNKDVQEHLDGMLDILYDQMGKPISIVLIVIVAGIFWLPALFYILIMGDEN